MVEERRMEDTPRRRRRPATRPSRTCGRPSPDGTHWFPALLDAVALWQLPEETVGERRYCYLIDGEAFDWLLLAERLIDSLDGAVPEEEREALLFFGQMPLDFDAEAFKNAIGTAKHTAYLNYLYGVIVEEALQLAVEEELHKERFAQCGTRCPPADEEVCERIYGKGRMELLDALPRGEGPACKSTPSPTATCGPSPTGCSSTACATATAPASRPTRARRCRSSRSWSAPDGVAWPARAASHPA